MKRIAVAGFQHETNTFSPIPTTYEDFVPIDAALYRKQNRAEMEQMGAGHYNSPVSGFYHRAKDFDFQMITLVDYSGEPSSAVPLSVFDCLMDDIVEQVKSSECDGLFLALHGAMALESFQDGETEILKRLRSVVGDIPIVASLDLHGNLDPQSVELVSAFVSCREYPHIDMFETGERCAVLMDLLLKNQPVYHAFRQIPFLLTCSKESTFRDPSKALYARINVVESWPEIYSASILQGFAGADMLNMGPSVLAYAGSQAAADKAVDFLYQSFLDMESEFTSNVPEPREAVAEAILLAKGEQKPVILADIQDNAGGGSSSETMFVLKELVRQHAPKTAVGMIFDPDAAAAAHAAGEGHVVELALGGKYIPGDSPLQANFEVERLHDGIVIGTGVMAKGIQFHIGKMALLRLDDIHIVVGSMRIQAADQALFTVLGINPAEMKIVVVKSANHYRADFEPIASHVLSVLAPGSDVEDPSTFTYVHLRPGVRLKGNGPVQK
jgi:microcystin degradation protein MlrC